MKTIQTKWQYWLLVVMTAVVMATVRADNSCIESGPHYSQMSCAQSGSVNNPGILNATNINVCIGQTIAPPTLITNATFNSGKMIEYVWYDCSPGLDYWQTNTVVYTAGALYFQPAIPTVITNAGTYTYTAKVNGNPSYGGCSVITDIVAVVTINVSSSPPIILSQPTNQTVFVGSNATFTVVATGCPGLSYQWWFNGTNQIVGATGSSLMLTNVQLTNAGNYSVTLLDPSGSTNSTNALLTVLTTSTPPYIILSGSLTNYTFRRDTTYYVIGPVNLYGANILEGSAVLKFTNSVNPSANPPIGAGIYIVGSNAVLNCQTGPYRPAIFTAKDDDAVGAKIIGSTGMPTNYYGGVGLYFDYSQSGTPANIQNVRMSFLAGGIGFNAGTGHIVSDVQIANCRSAFLTYTNGCSLRNVLVEGGTNVFLNASGTIHGENLTIYKPASFYGNSPATVYLTNSLVVGVANGVSYSGVYNFTLTNTFGVFETVGAGNCYLADDSFYRNAGTTNINSTLLSDLKKRTTYSPVRLTNQTIFVNETLVPQVQRDTDVPDLGYHYAPIDFIVWNLTVDNNVTLILTNGVAMACYNDVGINLSSGSAIVSSGTALAPNWFMRYSSVQEAPVSLGLGGPSSAIIVLPGFPGIGTRGSFQFSDFACPAGGGCHLYSSNFWSFSSLTVQNCEFWSGQNCLNIASNSIVRLKNNLFNRSAIVAASAAPTSILSLSNNLVWGTAAVLLSQPGNSVWTVFDNDFDSCSISNAVLTNGYNAYLNCSGRFSPTNANDIVQVNGLAYQSSFLGDYYQPTNSLLINSGSLTNAGLAGLYHFTTTTNQVKEGSSRLDMGYHYVAVGASGNPIDSNSNGIPDYLEDLNGNGLDDSGESPWSMAFLVQPQSRQVAQGSNVTFAVVVSGVAPLTYQWQFNGTNIPAATGSSYSETNVQLTNAGNYCVVVSDVGGSVTSSNAQLTVAVAPVITTQPASQTVIQGSNAIFSVAATGAPLYYQWYFDGTNPIAGATGSSYVRYNVSTNDIGTYAVIITNAAGMVISSNAVLKVPPVITLQPFSQTVLQGGTAAFSVAATGVAPLGYQWWFNGTSIVGATNASLTLTNAALSNAGLYFVVVSNTNGSVTSGYAVLRVWIPSSVMAWGDNTYGQSSVPAGLTNVVAIGVSAIGEHNLALKSDGTVVAWGGDWYGQANVPAGLSNVVAVAGGGEFSVALQGNGNVVAWGDGNVGQTAVPSNLSNVVAIAGGGYFSLALQANGAVVPWGWDYLGATDLPSNLSNVVAIAAGGYHSLALQAGGTVVAWGAGTNNSGYPNVGQSIVPAGLTNVVAVAAGGFHSMVLKRDGTVVAWGDNEDGQTNVPVGLTNVVAIAGGGDHSLALKSDGTVVAWGAGVTNSGSYPNVGQSMVPAGLTNVVAIGGGDDHSLVAYFLPVIKPAITAQPSGQTVTQGSNVTFSVTATGTPLYYQWYFNGTNPIAGATASSYTKVSAQPSDVGNYSVWVTNAAGSVLSSNAALTVNVPPFITLQPVSRTVVSGTNVTFSVMASGTTNLCYQWQFNGTNLTGATNALLTLSNIRSTNAGNYSVVVTNIAGSVISSNATLTVLVLPMITLQPASQTVVQGTNVTFGVTVTGTLPLNYQWWFNGAAISGATSASYTKFVVQPSDAGPYSVVVTNVAGSVTSSVATLTVYVPPAISIQPTNQTVAQGSNATLVVQASGTPTPTYQWLSNETNISGATSATYTTTNAGTYSVVVANAAGSVVSATATLSVAAISQIVVDGSSPQVQGGSTNTLGTVALRALSNPANVSYPTGYPIWIVTLPNATTITNIGTPAIIVTNASGGQYSITANCGASSASFTLLSVDPNADSDYDGVNDWQEILDGTSPTNANSVLPRPLGSWLFDNTTTWQGLKGQTPLLFSNVVGVIGVNSNGVGIDTTNSAILVYRDTEPGANVANINCRQGTLSFWFSPDWNSGTNGGPQRGESRLMEFGTKGTPNGCWGIYINNRGTNIYFCTQTNTAAAPTTNLYASINWLSNYWHFVTITYTPTNSFLYIDALLVTNGAGVTGWPSLSTRTNGFCIGGSRGGTNLACGRFDNFGCCNYPQGSNAIAITYSTACFSALDVMLVLDTSGSMTQTNGTGNSKIRDAEIAATNFIGHLNQNYDHAGLLTFSNVSTIQMALTTNFTALSAKILGLTANGSTIIENGITNALTALSTNHSPYALPVMVLLTDGSNQPPSGTDSWTNIVNAATRAKIAGIHMITVALGTNADVNGLFLSASPPATNNFFDATNTSILTNVFSSIATMLCRTNESPFILITNPVNYQIFNAAAPNIGATIPIFASVSDPESELSKVEFYWGSGTNTSGATHDLGGVTDSPYTTNWFNPPGGTNTLIAVAFSGSGLTATSAPVYVIVNNFPTITGMTNQTIIWPEGSTNVSLILPFGVSDDGLPYGRLTNSWTTNSGPGPVTFSNAVYVTNFTVGLPIVVSINTIATFSTNGTYVLQLTASDGAVSLGSNCIVTIKRRPVTYITGPTNNSNFNLGVPISLNAVAFDRDGYVTNVQFLANGTAIPGTVLTGMGGTNYSMGWNNVGVGIYSLTTVATDNDGLSMTSAPPVVITISNTAPFIQITNPINRTFLARTRIPVQAIASTPGGTISWVRFFAQTNYGINYSLGFGVATNGCYQMIWPPAVGGTYILTAEVMDSRGSNTWSAPVTNYIRNAPAVTVTSPTNSQIFLQSPTNLTVKAIAIPDASTTITNVTFYQGTNVIGTSASGVGNVFSITWNGVINGTYNLSAKAFDTNGGIGFATNVNITVETNQPPSVYAGPNQTINLLTNLLTMVGIASDDGLPYGLLTVGWANISGPTNVIFNVTNLQTTSVSFSQTGVYQFVLSASDGQYTTWSTNTITVLPPDLAPVVSAGTNQTIALAAQYILANDIVSATTSEDIKSSRGKEFWLGFPQDSTGYGYWGEYGNFFPLETSLFISSETNTSVAVMIPLCGYYTNYTISAGMATTIVIPTNIADTLEGEVTGNGIHILAQDDISVYGLSYMQYTSAGYGALPVSALGTNYIIPGWMTWYGSPGWESEFMVVGTAKGTTVTITPTVQDDSGQLSAGAPFVTNIDEGETFQVQSRYGELAGSIISADKPISVFAGDEGTYVPNQSSGYGNMLLEEIPPTAAWGERFFTAPLALRSGGDSFEIVAAEDQTTVWTNGTLMTTMASKGDIYQFQLGDSCAFVADKPILLCQFGNGSAWSGEPGDPCMMTIPPFEQFLSTYTVTTPSFSTNVLNYDGTPMVWTNFANIVVTNIGAGYIYCDGFVIDPGNFAPIGDSGFSYAQIPLLPGSHHLTSSTPFGLFMYGLAWYDDTYSYPGGFSLGSIANVNAIFLAPQNSTNSVDTTFCLTASVTDQNNQPVAGARVDFQISGSNALLGSAYTGENGQALFAYTGTNVGLDTITASVGTNTVFATNLWTLPFFTLQGSVLSDGIPTGTTNILWTQIGGPPVVSILNPRSLNPMVEVTGPGFYSFQLSVNNTVLTNSAQVGITVLRNQPPSVYAGTNEITQSASATLNGSVSDDRLPNGTLTTMWSVLSGPGVVTFQNANQPVTTATFSAPGVYDLRLTGNDSQAATFADVTVAVLVNPQPVECGQVVNGNLLSTSIHSIQQTNSYADYYEFSGQSNQFLVVTMTSTNFDTFLVIRNQQLQLLAEDDDSFDANLGSTNSRIIYCLPANGAYIIEATSGSAAQTGAYQIQFQCGLPAEVAITTPRVGLFIPMCHLR